MGAIVATITTETTEGIQVGLPILVTLGTVDLGANLPDASGESDGTGLVVDTGAWVPGAPTPAAHASSHATGGSDPITPAAIGALSNPGSWQSWTPTISGFALGDGTVDAHYCQVGKVVTCRLIVTVGSTSTIGDLVFTPPVTAAVSFTYGPIGIATALDAGTAFYFGNIYQIGTTDFRVGMFDQAGTYQTITGLTPTVPFTWAPGDRISATFTYEAA